LKDGLNLFYTANETFNKVFSFKAIFIRLVLCISFIDRFTTLLCRNIQIQIRQNTIGRNDFGGTEKPLKFSDKIDEETQRIIRKALQPKAENRFKSVKEFIQTLNGELEVEFSIPEEKATKIQPKEKKKGKGFSAIAGMQELKETIQLDVIDALNDKERYAEYGLTIPNGMLLYGPPGCGKTFFAEKMVEEIGFNFYQIKPQIFKVNLSMLHRKISKICLMKQDKMHQALFS
jgi:transitional endoplasmic reticulum ATPase